MHDPRIGRFFAVDPLAPKYPHYSPYGFSGNHVINSVELEGLEDVHVYNVYFDGDGNRVSNYSRTYQNSDLGNVDVNRVNFFDSEEDMKAGNIAHVTFKNLDGDKLISYSKTSHVNSKQYSKLAIEDAAANTVQTSQTGGANYQTGTVTLTDHSTGKPFQMSFSDPLINNPEVAVSSTFGGASLQVVQTVLASPTNSPGVQQMTIGGKIQTAFVDGGINSPAGESISGKPYYNTSLEMGDVHYANASWSGTSGAITALDIPTAAKIHSYLKFETYFVIVNYANTGQDLVVGRLDWEYKTDSSGKVTGIGTPKYVKTDSFSKNAASIIKHDYPNYTVVGGGGLK